MLMHASLTIENPIVANSTPSTTDVKTLPSSYPIPQDVDLKRLSVCSIDSSTTTVTTNEHGLNVDRVRKRKAIANVLYFETTPPFTASKK